MSDASPEQVPFIGGIYRNLIDTDFITERREALADELGDLVKWQDTNPEQWRVHLFYQEELGRIVLDDNPAAEHLVKSLNNDPKQPMHDRLSVPRQEVVVSFKDKIMVGFSPRGALYADRQEIHRRIQRTTGNDIVNDRYGCLMSLGTLTDPAARNRVRGAIEEIIPSEITFAPVKFFVGQTGKHRRASHQRQ